jgi:integrase
MKKPLAHTKVTVKLRKSQYKEEWYLIVEAYPVVKAGNKVERVVESVNRIITTPIWDKSSSTRSSGYKPKRDINGIIMCRSTLDQESCIYADNVRKLRQHEYDNQSLYTDKESEIAAQNERSEQDFIAYFKKITYSRHPNSSDAIIVNWNRVGVLLGIFSEGKPIPFSTISVKWMEEFKMFLLRAPQGGAKKGPISQNTASTYFSILKAGLKQAFVDEFLTVDISEKVKNIPTKESRREVLTIEEVNKLADTPCSNNILRRASFFSILTGLRHCDIQSLKWGQLVRHNDSWRINFDQEKTDGVEYMPISDQAYELCGERRDPDRLVFEGLMDPSWINRPVKKWIEAAGITKHITFHCFRHSYATIQLTNGTDIYTLSKMMGHTNVRTTQIYGKIVDSKKEKAAQAISIENLSKKNEDK